MRSTYLLSLLLFSTACGKGIYYEVSIPSLIINVNNLGAKEGRVVTDSILSISMDTITGQNTQALAFRRGKKIIITNIQSKSKMRLVDQHLDHYKLKGKYNESEIQVICTFDQSNNNSYWNFKKLYPTEFYLPIDESNNRTSFSIYSKEKEIEIEPLNSENGVIVFKTDSIKNHYYYKSFNYYELKELHTALFDTRNRYNDSSDNYFLYTRNDGRIYSTEDFEFNKIKNNEKRELNESLVGIWIMQDYYTLNDELSNFISDDFSLEIDSQLSMKDLRHKTPYCFLFGPNDPRWCLFGQLEISPSGKFLVLEKRDEINLIPFELFDDKLTIEVFPNSYKTNILLTRKRP